MSRLPDEVSPALGSMTLDLRSDPRFLGVVRAMVRSHCRLAGFDDQQTEQITLAVDESCANVIRHCYGGQTDQPLQVGLELDASGGDLGLIIRIRDKGPRAARTCFEPDADKDLERPGGLGLRLIHAIMDSVEVDESVSDGNLLVLRVGAKTDASDSSTEEDGA